MQTTVSAIAQIVAHTIIGAAHSRATCVIVARMRQFHRRGEPGLDVAVFIKQPMAGAAPILLPAKAGSRVDFVF
jgi:hypothetical protein